MDGLTLGRLFFEQAGRPIIESVISPDKYAAGLIGWSSEVLGFDDELSRDHNWGPRFILFLDDEDFASQRALIDQKLRRELPLEIEGFPTNFGVSPLGDQRAMQSIEEGPVNHFIEIYQFDEYLRNFLNIDPENELGIDDWLQLPEHNLLGFTEGLVFHDGLGRLEAWRSKLSFYPDVVWYQLMINHWRFIAEEEAFVGRCAARGDVLGSLLIIGKIVERIKRLVFLMERAYAPYSKWFGLRFMQLEHGPALVPFLKEALQGVSYEAREEALVKAYQLVARMHNELGVTPHVEETISLAYKGRPGLVLHAGRFADAIEQAIGNA